MRRLLKYGPHKALSFEIGNICAPHTADHLQSQGYVDGVAVAFEVMPRTIGFQLQRVVLG
ncbi:hypothetical protein AJ88_28840 [Mesorhizobium amorphae CCBAU 01583]|nr:hypothetical protein AJ88_28840 [Mesorhizobium amorphae CCBAU 01583]